jgi:hypothetical protein
MLTYYDISRRLRAVFVGILKAISRGYVLNGSYAGSFGSGTVVVGGVGHGRPAWIDLLKEELSEVFRTWMDANHLSGQDIADAVNVRNAKPGAPATRQNISDYRNGRSMPKWFLKFLGDAYPDWRGGQKTPSSVGRKNHLQNSAHTRDTENVVQMGAMMVVPDIDSPDYLSMLKLSHDPDAWAGPSALAPDVLNRKLPFQRIRRTRHAPAFKVSDALILLPNAEEIPGRIYAVTNTQTGKSDYAALLEHGDDLVWQMYDGSTIEFDQLAADAAVIAHFPQYNPNDPEGMITTRGLKVGVHIIWPKNNHEK